MPEDGLTVEQALDRLVADGFLRRDGAAVRTTARFQAALARAAYALQRAEAPWLDLRLPIAAALAAHYPDLPDADLAAMVEALLPVEERELAPVLGNPAVAHR
jgi:hypothetical protein